MPSEDSDLMTLIKQNIMKDFQGKREDKDKILSMQCLKPQYFSLYKAK